MAGFSRPARRFSLILLEEGEDYVGDWLCKCGWPSAIAGNWQSLESINGTLRLCSKSLFFEPEDVRVPIARCNFAAPAIPSKNATFAVFGAGLEGQCK